MASLHDDDNNVIFDIIIVTDRVVVDRQLQKAILGMDHKNGLIRVMDDRCTSADLAYELTHAKMKSTKRQSEVMDIINQMKNKGEKISFYSVAKASGAFLYSVVKSVLKICVFNVES